MLQGLGGSKYGVFMETQVSSPTEYESKLLTCLSILPHGEEKMTQKHTLITIMTDIYFIT